jgi:hypothetical protein
VIPPRPLAHRAATRLLESAWRSGRLPEPRLEPEALIEDSSRGAEGDDPDIVPVLTILLHSLREEAALNALGRTMAYGQIRAILASRLRAQTLWRHHPEILDRPVAAPVVILGQMRSGTTRLQRLLACDPQFAGTAFFEASVPVPPEGADLRTIQARLALAGLRAFNPALPAVHPTSPYAPEEQFGLLSFSLYGAQLEAQWRVPGFARYWRGTDKQVVYRGFKRLLQTIGWARGDDPARPWLLKAPQFMEDLPDFLRVFPDARLLCLYRDPVQVVGSSASLVWNQMLIQSDAADPHWIGREWLDVTARRAQCAAHTRPAYPQANQLDLDFEATTRDWLREMRRIYAFLGRPLTAVTETRMRRYQDRARRQPHHRHSYDLETFGLTEAAVRDRLR